jgi:hypothetical protein
MAKASGLMEQMGSLLYMDNYGYEMPDLEDQVQVGDFVLVTKTSLVRKQLSERGYRGKSLFADVQILTGHVEMTPLVAQANPIRRRDESGFIISSIDLSPSYWLTGVRLHHQNGAIYGGQGVAQSDMIFYPRPEVDVDIHIQRIVDPEEIYPLHPDIYIPSKFRPLS